MHNKLPNFLIVGAAKCGTSSLHNYLLQHPQIFMSKIKEPRFISSQFTPFPLNGPRDRNVERKYVKTFEDYVKLFENADGYSAVGESSADTLYFYKQSIPVIKQFLGNPKIIIVLRNPVSRSFSAYQHLLRDFREELSFEEGLMEEPNRIKNNWELIYHYTAVSKYYEAVKAFLENFTDVKVVLNEDLAKRPHQTVSDIFSFLGVDPDYPVNTEIKFNVSGKTRSRWMHEFLFEENKARKIVQHITRRLFSFETRQRIFRKLSKMNKTRLRINPETKKKLQQTFKDDILKLQNLLQRDLSGWLEKQNLPKKSTVSNGE